MSAQDISLFIKATGFMYADCAKRASVQFARNWIALPASIALFIVFRQLAALIAPFGMGAGMLLGLIQIIFLSYYYDWLHESVNNKRLVIAEMKEFNYGIFSPLIGVGFVLFIVNYVLGTFFVGVGSDWLLSCLALAIAIIFNCIPEVIVTHRYDSLSGLSHAARFITENWPEWFFPILLLLLPILFTYPVFVLHMFTGLDPLLPTLFLMRGITWSASLLSVNEVLASCLGVVASHWFMLFRLFLFMDLESGSRRRRIYQAKNR